MHQPWAVFNQLCWLYLIEYSCTYYSACSSTAVMLHCDFHMYSAQQTWMYSIHQVHYLHVHNLYLWVITGYVGDFDQNLDGAFHLCLFPFNFRFIYISKWFIIAHCKRICGHILHLAHQLLHLLMSESIKLSLQSLASRYLFLAFHRTVLRWK